MNQKQDLRERILSEKEAEMNNNENEQITYNFMDGAKEMIINGPFNLLFVFIPAAFLCEMFDAPDGFTFAFSLLSIAPLAERLGFVTEQLAMHTNDTIGGLLNVTFGNATELIVAVIALQNGLYRVVQLTLLGSILSNLLLVLGCAFIAGGLRFLVQSFGRIFSQSNMPLLLITCMGVTFPTALVAVDGSVTVNGGLLVSRIASIVMFILYCLYIYFQLISHRQFFEEEPPKAHDLGFKISNKLPNKPLLTAVDEEPKHDVESHSGGGGKNDNTIGKVYTASGVTVPSTFNPVFLNKRDNSSASASANIRRPSVRSGSLSSPTHSFSGRSDTSETVRRALTSPRSFGTGKKQASFRSNASGKSGSVVSRASSIRLPYNAINDVDAGEEEEEDEDEEDEDVLGINYALFWLFVVTVLISFLSDFLVATIQPAAETTGMSNVFLSGIVIPIIGNAAEHASAVIFGYKNKLDLSLAIAVGSATQIGLFLMPLLVLIGWVINKPMSMDFEMYEVGTLVLAVVLVGFILQNAKSTWLDGVVLVGAYIVVAGAFYAHKSDPNITG